MGWFTRKAEAAKAHDGPVLVRFDNGKYGVRKPYYDGYQFLDLKHGRSWWVTPEYWSEYCQADADTALKWLDREKGPRYRGYDIGAPV